MDSPSETSLSDLELLDRTSRGDSTAFGQLVARHQSLVCAVAYSIVGDLARSEDVAQEAFVAAWQKLSQLHDLAKFKSWLCGITRNLAFLAIRKEHATERLDAHLPLAAAQPTPAEQAVSREEETLVWSALEALPETYREPLVLYYRDDESIARVAEALELSEDAVKQRLARGREMLRSEIAATVERALKRSGPGVIFTLSVLGALPGIGAASASAATIGAAGKAAVPLAAATVKAGMLAALLGSLGGVAGGAFGAWASWKTARYQRERDLYRRSIIIYVVGLAIFIVPFLAMAVGWQPWQMGTKVYLIAYGVWMAGFFGASGIWMWYFFRAWRRVVAEETAAGSPMLPSTTLHRELEKWEGRQWSSRRSLLGLPLVHVNFGSPSASLDRLVKRERCVARGWIAIGDRAYGLLAVGNVAVGGIALGGISFGIVALGGLGIGVIGVGGFGAGLFAAGGGAVGLLATGGLAVGWLALGGAAFAWKAAKGGFALAHEFAIGGAAVAPHANDAAARSYVESSSFFTTVEPALARLQQSQQTGWLEATILGIALVAAIIFWLAAYRRNQRRAADKP